MRRGHRAAARHTRLARRGPRRGQRATSPNVTGKICPTRRRARSREIPSRSPRRHVVLGMLDFFREGGFNMYPLTIFGVALLATGIKFARDADAQRLAL